MNIFAPFYDKPRLTILAIGLILVAGLAAIVTLPRQEDPIPEERYATIQTRLLGASATRIEALITDKIEDTVREIPEVKKIESTSRTGVSVVGVELQDAVVMTDEVWSRVRAKIDDVEPFLPADAEKPELEVNQLPAETLLVSLTAADGAEVPLSVINRLAKDLETRLRNVHGTEKTDVFGEPGEEYLVTIDPDRLAGAGLSLADVSSALALADTKAPSGQLRTEGTSLIVEVGGELDSLDRIRSVPVTVGNRGEVMRVGDLALVKKAQRDPPVSMAMLDGKRGIAISALMQETQRVDLWAESAKAVVADFEQTLPATIDLDIIIDQSVYTQGRLIELTQNFSLGVAMVVGLLLLVMGWRSAILVGISLPLSVGIVMTALKFLDIPMHQMSVTGMIIALGLLIDNAIVVIDEYNHNRERGLRVRDAAITTVRHLQVPLFASTLTTALTFAPIYLMPGGAGDFVGSMALAVIIAIFASLFVSLTIVPALAAFSDKRGLAGRGSGRNMGYRNVNMLNRYRATLDWVLRQPKKAIALCLALPFLGFFLSSQLAEQFFPPVDRDQFQVQMTLPADAPISETLATVEKVNAVMDRYQGITHRHWFVGEAAPKAFYNVILSKDGLSSFAAAIVETQSADITRDMLPDLQRVLMQEVPNAEVLALPFEQGPPVAAPIEVRIVGPDVDVLRTLGEQVRMVLAQSENVTYTRAQISGGQPKLILQPDEDAARQAGYSLRDVADSIAAGLEGITGGSVLEETEELPVRVRLAGDDRSAVDRLFTRSLAARGEDPAGVGIPISALTKMELVPEDSAITRRNRERVNEVQGFIVPFTLPSIALADFQARMADANINVPPGYRFEFGGDAESRNEAVGNLMSSVGILLVIMIGTIILTFNSARYAAVIFSVALLSVGFAFLSLWLFNQPRGFMAIVGSMGLIGLAINGAIVVLTNLRADANARAVDLDAIRDTVVASTRHIVGTTMTTIAGFLPLILWADSFWQPLSLAIAGGVIGSAVLALYFTPAMFVLIARAKNEKKARDIAKAQHMEAIALQQAAE